MGNMCPATFNCLNRPHPRYEYASHTFSCLPSSCETLTMVIFESENYCCLSSANEIDASGMYGYASRNVPPTTYLETVPHCFAEKRTARSAYRNLRRETAPLRVSRRRNLPIIQFLQLLGWRFLAIPCQAASLTPMSVERLLSYRKFRVAFHSYCTATHLKGLRHSLLVHLRTYCGTYLQSPSCATLSVKRHIKTMYCDPVQPLQGY